MDLCDVNQAARERAVARVNKAKGYQPKEYTDMRQMFDSKDIDAVSTRPRITGTPWLLCGQYRPARMCM